MKYTAEEYKCFLDRYYKDIGKDKGYLLTFQVYRHDLLNDNIDEQNIIIMLSDLILKMCSKSNNYENLIEKRNELKRFYDWCIRQRPQLITWQPFESELLQSRILLHKMAENTELKILTDELVEEVCGRFEENRPYYEMLVRIFYEGMPSIETLLDITVRDIDFKEQTVRIKGEWRKFSEKTFQVIREYLKMTAFTITPTSKKKYQMNLVCIEDRFIKKCVKRKEDSLEYNRKNMNNSICKSFMRISDIAGFNINAEILYKSGFINYVYKMCGDNKEKFARLFIGVVEVRSSKTVGRLLEVYAENYGVGKTNKKIRMNYSIYAYKFLEQIQ